MNEMFYDCHNLKEIDLSSFDLTNVKNMESIFAYCKLKKIKIKNQFKNKFQHFYNDDDIFVMVD